MDIVIIKTTLGEELISIFCSESNGIVKVQHPHFVHFNSATSNMILVPYCPLSNETYFEFKRDNLIYLVTASDDVSMRFIEACLSSSEEEYQSNQLVSQSSQLIH